MRAENLVHGSDQQGCDPGRSAVMITAHVPAVRVPPDHTGCRVAAAVGARGGVEDGRNLDPAPSARRTTAAAAGPGEAQLGGPGPARGTARRDTQSPPPRTAAAGHPGHHPALAPRHHPAPPGGAVHARQDRPAGHPPDHQGPGPPAGPRQPRLGLPPDPRGTGRPGSASLGVDGMGDPQGQRHRPRGAADRSRPGRSSCALRPTRSWPATSSQSASSTAPRLTSWP